MEWQPGMGACLIRYELRWPCIVKTREREIVHVEIVGYPGALILKAHIDELAEHNDRTWPLGADYDAFLNANALRRGKLLNGTPVLTVEPKKVSTDWTGAAASRRWGVQGTVIGCYGPSHGLIFEVKHPDGTIAPYEAHELQLLDTEVPKGPRPFAWDDLAQRAVRICRQQGWALDWNGRGNYLHLEASELVEAMRGKGDSTVAEEAGDVLFVLLTILATSEVSFVDVVRHLETKMAALER